MNPSSQLVVAQPTDQQPYPQSVPDEFTRPGPSMAQIFAILWAYRRVSLIILTLCVVLTGVVTKLLPKTYKATTTLILQYDVNDPLMGREFPVSLLSSYLATQIELMQSPEILRPVIQKLHLTEMKAYAAGNRGGPDTLTDWVEQQLRKTLDFEPGRQGNRLMYITASASTPELAAQIANEIADGYLSQPSVGVGNGADKTRERYAAQLETLKKKVSDAQEALADLRRRSGSADVNPKNDVEVELLTSLEQRLLDSQNLTREAAARAGASQSASSQSQSSELVRTMRRDLSALQERMASLRTTLGPKHPQIVELQSQIETAERSLNAAGRSVADAAGAELASRRQAQAELEQSIRQQRQKVAGGRRFRDEAIKLQLELDSAEAIYKKALDGYDQVMVASAGRFTTVNVASQARPPLEPSSPKTIPNLLFGALAGLILGLGGPFVYELLNRRVRCRDDLERDLGMPVLVEFQPLPPGLASPA